MFRSPRASLLLVIVPILLLAGCRAPIRTDSTAVSATIAVTFDKNTPFEQQKSLITRLEDVDGVVSVEPYSSGALSAQSAGIETGGPSLEVRMRPGDAKTETAVRRIINQYRQQAGVSYVTGD